MQFFSRLEPDCLARRDGDFRTGPRIAAYPGFAGAHIEHTKASQLNAVTRSESFFQAFKDSIDGRFRFVPR